MRQKLREVLYGIPIVLTSMLVGCINNYDECPPASEEANEPLSLSIRMLVPGMGNHTRADKTGDTEHSTEKGIGAESSINIDANDFHLLVFGEDGWQMLEMDAASVEVEKEAVDGSDDLVSYTLTSSNINNKEAGFREGAKMQVMVLANWESFDAGSHYSFANTSIKDGAESENLFLNGTDYNFTMPVDGTTTWIPSTTDRNFIPMFGISDYITLGDMSGKTTPIETSISMLRSLAKIEVVNQTPEEDKVEIVGCCLTWYNTKGRFIPNLLTGDNEKWNDQILPNTTLTYQVSSPSLPDEETTAENLNFALVDATDGNKIEVDEDEPDYADTKFVAYVPEMDLSALTPGARPVIEVEIAVKSDNGELTRQTEALFIELSEYSGKDAINPYDYILRNHLYRFNVKSIELGVSGKLEFIIETPWQQTWNESGQEEWDFEDVNVEFEEAFRWTESINYDEEPDNPLIPQRTLVITQDAPVVGTFKLKKPVKGTWSLALYADDNTLNNHFSIDVLKDGNWVEGGDAITGEVGEEITFRIIPTATNNDSNHYIARVVMTCMTFDGQIKEVNLTGGEELPTVGNNGYFFVKQYYSGFGDNGDDPYEANDLNQ